MKRLKEAFTEVHWNELPQEFAQLNKQVETFGANAKRVEQLLHEDVQEYVLAHETVEKMQESLKRIEQRHANCFHLFSSLENEKRLLLVGWKNQGRILQS